MDFYITQILREISFGECKASINVVFAIFGAMYFDNLVILSLQKVQKFTKIKL